MAGPRNRLLAAPEFLDRLEELRAAAAGGDRRAATTYAEVVRVVRRLGNGKELGHHPLTDRTGDGRGDLRDCTVSEFRSDPNGKVDCRLVWRQLASQQPDTAPVRELINVGRRRETPDVYAQTMAVLERGPNQRLAENAPFADPAYTGDENQPARKAALDDQRSIALARTGVAPMAKSRPLSDIEFGTTRDAGVRPPTPRTQRPGQRVRQRKAAHQADGTR